MSDELPPWSATLKANGEKKRAQTITTRAHYELCHQQIKKAKMILLDTETDGLSATRKTRLVQICTGIPEIWLLDPEKHRKLIRQVMDTDGILWAHNLAFDLITLALWRWPKDQEAQWEWYRRRAPRDRCTMVAHQIITSSQRVRSLSHLASLSGVHNDPAKDFDEYIKKMGISTEDQWSKVPRSSPLWLRYSAWDIVQLTAAFRWCERRISDTNGELIRAETVVELLYAWMEHVGVRADLDQAVKSAKRLFKKEDALVEKLAREHMVSGTHKTAEITEALQRAGWKPSKRTSTGRISVDKHVLRGITRPKPARKLAQSILKARSLHTDGASYARLAAAAAQHTDLRLHPHVWRIGAITGRSSCESPNLQQLNKWAGDPGVRRIIMADEGEVVVAVDFDGLEVRVLAELSGDKHLAEWLNEGVDVHGDIAMRMHGRNFTPVQRDGVKRAVFAMLYGAGPRSMASNAGISVDEARAVRKTWDQAYSRAASWRARVERDAAAIGRTRLPCGWTVEVPSYGGEVAAYKAVNYQVQGTAAFLFRQSMVMLWKAGMWPRVRMVVHDEAVLTVPVDRKKKFAKLASNAMTLRGKHVVFTTDATIYDEHWGRAA